MNSHSHEQPMSVKIPADVDQPDKILYGLTARQLAILGATAAVLVWVLLTFPAVLPFPVLVAVLIPIAAGGIVLAVARRDGMSLDRYLVTALTHMRTPRTRVTTGGPVPAPPSWCRMRGRLPAPLRLPVGAVRTDGVMELAGGGVAAMVRAGTVAFGLRTPGEQASLVAGFRRWLNSLDAPVQILVQARPVDLTDLAGRVTAQATGLPDPALEQAAGEHAAFLSEVGAAHDLLVRHVLLVFTTTPAASTSPPWGKGRRQRIGRDAGAEVVVRRAAEAVQSLAALGVAAEVLDSDSCVAALTESLSPGEPRPVGTAAPDEIITAGRQS